MTTISSVYPGINPGCDRSTSLPSSASPTTPRPTSAPWRIRIPADVDLAGISPPHLKMLLILEGYCRDKSYSWPGNATLAARYGCSPRQAQSILRDMEAAGILWRLPVNPDRPTDGRAGIFLHRRLDPDLPVEDRPPPHAAVARLWAARERTAPPTGGCAGIFVPPARGISQPPRAGNLAGNNDTSSKKDESHNNDARVVVEGNSTEKGGEAPGAIPGAGARPPEDLAPLVARATARFEDATAAGVERAVDEYGREWVEIAIWGLVHLRFWGGVMAALRNWRAGPLGPRAEEVKAARRAMAAAQPTTYHRARRPTEAERAEAREAGRRLRELTGLAPGSGISLTGADPG